MILSEAIHKFWAELSQEQVEALVKFHTLLVQENEVQNLTRLISPEDFIEGHLFDVRELFGTGWVDYPTIDMGSGCGVPGIPGAIVGGGKWILTESEGRKADFLSRATQALGLDAQVDVYAGRAEKYLEKNHAEMIVARAVGPIERIYSWIRPCSTWNTLVLLKGPKWDEEWAAYESGRFRGELILDGDHFYEVGAEKKRRRIVRLRRKRNVPRGTQKNLARSNNHG